VEYVRSGIIIPDENLKKLIKDIEHLGPDFNINPAPLPPEETE